MKITITSNKNYINITLHKIDFIKVEKEVTDDKKYRNSSIYKALNKERPKIYQKV